MDIGGDASKASDDHDRTIINALVSRGFHNVRSTGGTVPKARLVYKEERASLPIDQALPLIQSAASENDLWNRLRDLGVVRPKSS